MTVPYALLGLLEAGPLHGYELKRRYDQLFAPERPLAYGQVYATLARLTRDGHAAAQAVEREDGPDRRRYGITTSGEAALDSWLQAPLEPQPRLHAELYAKVALAALSDKPIEPLLDAQRTAHLASMRELTSIRRDATMPTALLADYVIYHLEADLQWMEMSAGRINEWRAQLRSTIAPMETA